MKKIKVKIVKNSFEDTCWYANQIGQELYVERDEGDEDYVFWRQSPAQTWIIKKSDCEVIDEPAPQPEPFDIDKALRGGEVVTRSGLPVKIKQVMKSHAGNKVHAMVEDGLLTMHCVFSEDGNFDPLTEHKLDLFMAPKEPEYLEGWVIVDKYGIAPCVYPDVKSASHSAVFNNADRKFKIEKIRLPKP